MKLREQSSVSEPPGWQLAGAPHVWMPYSQMKHAPLPVPIVRTEGVYVYLDDGTRLIDGMSSWWTACHGYNHPHLTACVAEQLQQMPHVMFGGVHHPQALRLAKRLADLLPGSLNHVFFSDSGSVSVEVALKMAVQYWLNRNVRGRHQFVSFRNAYHGDTTGAMSVCDPVNSMHAHFDGLLPKHYSRVVPHTKAEVAELDQFLETHREQLAGLIIEPLVQNAGGMRFHEPETLVQLRRLCDKHDLLLIADEIATGFGRTGSLFACEQADIVPDIMCLGKSLTGGMLSMACTVATERVFETFWSDDPNHALMHGPTYMANPLACAAANGSLDLFEQEPSLEQARNIEAMLAELLEPCRRLSNVVDVRCRGGIGVIECKSLGDLNQLRLNFLQNGVLLRPYNGVVYLIPPLTIEPEQLTLLAETTVDVVTRFFKQQ